MQTCTWAPTVFQGNQVVNKNASPAALPAAEDLQRVTVNLVQRYESLGISHLLIAQRWWGDGNEIEASSLDCLAMTALFAGATRDMQLITAIHPGFFQPAAIAKWGATLQQLTGGRWAINVTSGWNMREFDMYGVDKLTHDERYRRSMEFIQVLRGCWQQQPFSYDGHYYHCDALELAPRPQFPLQVFQGGQSDAAINMAAAHSDWMFLNGGSLERLGGVISRVREACRRSGRTVRFAMYAAPLCRDTDDAAWEEIEHRLAKVDQVLLNKRQHRLREGAEGMWDEDDPLSALDSNEGYAARLIGSAGSILQRIRAYRELGVEMLHLDLQDSRFNQQVLPELHTL